MTPELISWLASVSNDPYAFVLGAFPWGEPGTSLENDSGPTAWQTRHLKLIRDKLQSGEMSPGEAVNYVVQIATTSGHGVGKSCEVSWLIIWAIATFPDTRGVVTANTETQLKTKTWAELGKWYNLFIGREHFTLTATALFAKDPAHERTWRIDMVPWSEKNTEAFAGLHNKGRRILLVFDEASAIPDIIWQTSEGVLTDADTQIIWCVYGNPTRNTGRFRECFGNGAHAKAWENIQVDSRTVPFTNKEQIKKWEEAYGDDSDFFRVRVKGQFPRVGEMEFISSADVEAAITREEIVFKNDPLCLGVDVARFGSNETVLWFRKGRDARTIPPICLRGADTVAVAAKVSEVFHQYRVDAVFVDGGGVGGGVVDQLRSLHVPCFDIQFGGKSESIGFATGTEGERYANKRAEMWGSLRGWLKGGAIPADPELRSQLIGPTYTFNLRNEIQLEKKEDMMKRGLASPDRADALALTFAYPVAAHQNAGGDYPHKPLVESEYNPFDAKYMEAA